MLPLTTPSNVGVVSGTDPPTRERNPMNHSSRPAKRHPMWDSIFVPGCSVDTRRHREERDAQRDGATTLAEYHAWRRANPAR
ncbi:hypothetical protein SEA_AXUMITE_77 [Gordonia phage Axumite]|nr:hypothetical protein SEA_AXUMITE_77 [Gordonia phage Axumite]